MAVVQSQVVTLTRRLRETRRFIQASPAFARSERQLSKVAAELATKIPDHHLPALERTLAAPLGAAEPPHPVS